MKPADPATDDDRFHSLRSTQHDTDPAHHARRGTASARAFVSTGWIAPACGWRTHSITSSARGEERMRNGKAKRLGGREINHELDFRRLFDREIAWLRPA
jgi:hypothetical protein